MIRAPNAAFPAWMRHCAGEILAAVVIPNDLNPVVGQVQRFILGASYTWGYSGMGTASVVCDPLAYPALQCEVFSTAVSQWKQIVNWRFCVNGSGFCGFSMASSERNNLPGETDFPIAVSPRSFGGSGRTRGPGALRIQGVPNGRAAYGSDLGGPLVRRADHCVRPCVSRIRGLPRAGKGGKPWHGPAGWVEASVR